MLYAAVAHAPHPGTEPIGLDNEAAFARDGRRALGPPPTGAVAVAADSWWRARRPSRR